jgi:hypothetical protein
MNNKEVLKKYYQINKATERDHRDYSKPMDVQFVCHQCNCGLERLQIC